MAKYTFTTRVYTILLLLLGISSIATASHIVGGKITYKYLGLSGTKESYEVILTIYEDCFNGQPDAIEMDNPAFLAIYEKNTKKLIVSDTSIRYSSSVNIPVGSLNPCKTLIGSSCVLEKQFRKTFTLPVNTNGYVVSYQRCCLTASIVNITTPGDLGITYYCIIPPSKQNSSAVFKQTAQRLTCIHDLLAVDCSATDEDGDSLTYELTNSLNGASPDNIKPLPAYPGFDSIPYRLPCTTLNPVGTSDSFFFDTQTGIFTVKPDRVGVYLVALNCIEWRGGIAINKVYQQFQIIVADCASSTLGSGMSAGKDTAIVKGGSVHFNAQGGSTYHWSKGTNLSNDSIANPTAFFPETGIFTYVVTITNSGGCIVTDTVRVFVLEQSELVMPNAFTPNGDGINDVFGPQFIGHSDVKYFKVFNRYGNMVYNGTGNWDGTYKGHIQDMEIFCWELLYENSLGQPKFLKGNVILIK